MVVPEEQNLSGRVDKNAIMKRSSYQRMTGKAYMVANNLGIFRRVRRDYGFVFRQNYHEQFLTNGTTSTSEYEVHPNGKNVR